MSETITLAHLSDVHLSPVRGLPLRYLNVKRGQTGRCQHGFQRDLVTPENLGATARNLSRCDQKLNR